MDGRGVEKGLSVSELYHRVFPEYLAMGMTYDQFWKGDCTLVIPYREAYRIRQEEMNRMAAEGYRGGEDVLGCRRRDGGESLLALINRSDRDVECFGVTVPARGTLLA